jgi:hypothetical protein
LLRVIITEADHAAIIDGDIRFVNLAAQDVDQPRVFEKQRRRLFAARDTEFVLNFAHWNYPKAALLTIVILIPRRREKDL